LAWELLLGQLRELLQWHQPRAPRVDPSLPIVDYFMGTVGG